jgi:hypothetical protein
MLHTPITYRALACGLAVVLTFGLMRLLDVAATRHRNGVMAMVATTQGVQQVLIIGARVPRT